ncbi:hypothetical protein Tco_0537724 [Tanacetum coccineum]
MNRAIVLAGSIGLHWPVPSWQWNWRNRATCFGEFLNRRSCANFCIRDQASRFTYSKYLSSHEDLTGVLKSSFTIIVNQDVNMDDPNITMEEYIRLEEEKSRRRGKVYYWETATYVFNDTLTSEVALSCEPMVSPLSDNQIDFIISFDEFDDVDYTVIYDKSSFSYKIISVNDLKTDSKNDNDKVNMPSFPSSDSTVSYFNDFDYFKDFEKEFPAIAYNDALTSKLDFSEPIVSPQHIDEFDETSLFKCDD